MKKMIYDKRHLPPFLGVQDNLFSPNLVKRLDEAMSQEYHDQLAHRVLEKYEGMTEDEFECLLFELKRYFLITVMTQEIMMFSQRVDDIWHEMLMFTREYQRFCEQFSGEMIHHTPNLKPKHEPSARAWFDWMYIQMFKLTPYSWQIWKGFFYHPLDHKFLQSIRVDCKSKVKERLFNRVFIEKYHEISQTMENFIDRLREVRINE